MTSWHVHQGKRIGSMLHEPGTRVCFDGEETIPEEHPIIGHPVWWFGRCIEGSTTRVKNWFWCKMECFIRGLSEIIENATQALLYVAVSKKGAEPVDGGGTVVTGPFVNFSNPLAKGISVRWLNGLHTKDGREICLELRVWFALFVFSCSVGAVVEQHREQADALWGAEYGSFGWMRHWSSGLWPLMSLFHVYLWLQGAVKEWPWRNGWLWDRVQGFEHAHYIHALELA